MTLAPPPVTGARRVPPRSSDLRLVLVLLGVALAARAITFGNPILHVDEEFYFAAARAWSEGAIPYVDIWDRKPIGLFALYLPAAALGYPAGIWAYQAMASAAVVATAWAAARIARAAGWGDSAMLAGIAYILWIILAEGEGGQSPVFYNLPVAGAALLIVTNRAARPMRAAAAMALVGVAMQIKYSVVFEGVFFGLYSLAQHWRSRRNSIATLAFGGGLVAVASAPTAAVAAAYAIAGHFDAFRFANFASILTRRADPLAEQLGNAALVVAILSPLVAMAIVAFVDARRRGLNADLVFVFGWLAAALTGLGVFGSWFDHYALPVMLPGAICAAGAVTWRREVRRAALPTLIVIAFAGQAMLVAKRLGRGTPAQFAALVDTVGRGPGCLYVYSGSPMTYAATDRCRLSRYVFPSHLSRRREQGAIGVDQASEVRRILAANPAVIVMRPPYRGERPEVRAIVAQTVAARYRLTAALPMGRETVRVFAATSAS